MESRISLKYLACICLVSFLTAFMSGCSDDDSSSGHSILVNGLESASLEFDGTFSGKAGIDFKQTVTVTSSVQFSVTNVPDWLNVSPSNGKGSIEMSIYPKSENNSSVSRSAVIKIQGNDDSCAEISVIQHEGLSKAKVTPANTVALYNQIGWELESEGNTNSFQLLLLTKDDLERMTEKELLNELMLSEQMKYKDQYMFFYSKDSHNNKITPNTTYYICTVSYDMKGEIGSVEKSRIVTPVYYDGDKDAWARISDEVHFDLFSGFQFSVTKDGYCKTYHTIYGCLNDYYPSIAFVFEINYYIKNKSKHWFSQKNNLEISTNYPNDHVFTYNTTELLDKPIISICTWGVFENGTESSDAMLFRGDISEVLAPMRSNSHDLKESGRMVICGSDFE